MDPRSRSARAKLTFIVLPAVLLGCSEGIDEVDPGPPEGPPALRALGDGSCRGEEVDRAGIAAVREIVFRAVDGTLTDRTGTSTRITVFDQQGRLASTEVRNGADLQFRQTETFNADGTRSTFRTEYPGGSSQILQYAYLFYPTGRLRRWELLSTDSGASRFRRHYAYDVAGRLRVEAFDRDADGSIEVVTTTFYRPDGLLDRREAVGTYHGGDSVTRWRFEHDVAGRPVLEERDGGGYWDSSADGTPDVRATWSYAPGGTAETWALDGSDASDDPMIDGVPDARATFEPACDPLGRVFRFIYRYP